MPVFRARIKPGTALGNLYNSYGRKNKGRGDETKSRIVEVHAGSIVEAIGLLRNFKVENIERVHGRVI